MVQVKSFKPASQIKWRYIINFQISKHITRIAELKSSNFKLSKKLEEAMERYELLASHRTDLENEIENIQVRIHTSNRLFIFCGVALYLTVIIAWMFLFIYHLGLS